GSVSRPLAPPLSSWPHPQTQAPPPLRVQFYHSRPRPADSGTAPSPHCPGLAPPLRPRPGRPPYWSFCPRPRVEKWKEAIGLANGHFLMTR
ncbi:hypothetical protein U0070_007932, partial [Myodes glareolus]